MPLPVAGAAILGGASLLGSIAGGLFGSSAQASANETNIKLARESQDWQSAENQKSRDWQQMMWNMQNEYNSPAHMRELYRQGGYNPYLLGSENLGAGAGSAGTPSQTGAPNVAHVSPVNPMSGLSAGINGAAGSFADYLSLYQQSQQVDSNVELQHVKAIQSLSETAIKAYNDLGYKGFKDLMDRLSPVLSSLNFQGSRSDVLFDNYLKDEISKRYNLDMNSLVNELSYELGKEYTPQQIRSSLEKTEYEISEIVGRLNSMSIQNQALIDRTAAEVVEKTASAYNLRKSGDKFEADTKTVNAIRESYTRIIKGKATQSEVAAYFASAEKESSSSLVGYMTSKEGRDRKAKAYSIGLEQKSSDLIRACDKVLGEYFNVGFSYGQ